MSDGWNPLDPEPETTFIPNEAEMTRAKLYWSVFSRGEGKKILEEMEEAVFNGQLYNPQTKSSQDEMVAMVFRDGQRDIILRIKNYIRIAEEGDNHG